jgi:hypothetical protein
MTDVNPTDVESHLLARLKLQRVIFGGCALVLVTLTVLGISAYRDMQRDVHSARLEQASAEETARERSMRILNLEDDLSASHAGTLEQRRATALEKCRLAAHDLARGDEARAREGLQAALALGAPAWAPLLQHALRAGPPRFSGSAHADAAILCGSISGDRRRLAVVRRLPGGCVLESYDTGNGKLAASCALPAASDADVRLDRDGARFAARVGGRLFTGPVAGPASALPPAPGDIADNGVRFMHASIGLEAIAVGANTQLLSFDGEVYREADLPRDAGRLRAVCPLSDGRLGAICGSRLLVEGDKRGEWDVVQTFGHDSGPATLFSEAGVLRAATVSVRTVELVSLPLDGSADGQATRHSLPPTPDPWTRIQFLDDGGLFCATTGGAATYMGPGEPEVWEAARGSVVFAALGPHGLICGTDRGEIAVRETTAERLLGFSLLTVPADFEARAEPGGFVLSTPGGNNQVLVAGKWLSVGNLVRVFPADATIVGSDGDWNILPDGKSLVATDGLPIAAWPSGDALLWRAPSSLVLSSRGGGFAKVLPAQGAPDAVAVAALQQVAALHVGGGIYVVDRGSEPRKVAGPRSGPVRLALSADGLRLAVAREEVVDVTDVRQPRLRHELRVAARAVALLFGGTLLAGIEPGGRLAFYEVETGRQLLAIDADATELCTASDDTLHLIAGNRMRILRLTE